MNYRLTLNLPNSNFSMKADLVNLEPFILKFWDSVNIYSLQADRSPVFVLNDGPPYANGDIHIGHAFNKILKDIIIKFKMLEGYRISFVPGWDCHGLPIELNVEKKYKNLFLSADRFRYFCRKYAFEQINIQKKSFLRLGIFADWQYFYKTMSKSFEAVIIDSLKLLVSKGYIYSGKKPIYWCFDCTSALAEAEVEYFFKTSVSLYLSFKFFDPGCLSKVLSKFLFIDVYLVVWTTTPWTLPFNEAVAVQKNVTYVLFLYCDNIYIVSSGSFDSIIKKFNMSSAIVLCFFNSGLLSKVILKHPFYDKLINVFFSDHVKDDSGTGCVHIAPAYGYDDYKLALKHKLPIKNSINEKGFFNKDVLFFAGMHFNDVNLFVIDVLLKNNSFVFSETVTHRYPFCWRHKTPLIYRTTNQWFFYVNEPRLKKRVLFSIDNIKWIPCSGKERMAAMISNRPDWCISRQRLWGVPLILFVSNEGVFHKDTLIILKKSFYFIKKYGMDFWFRFDVFDLFFVDKLKFNKVLDVLDVWFDSSVVYKYMLDIYGFSLPLDLCLEGSDQFRGWFQASLINCIATYSVVPYKTIIAHGFVLDQFGRKMSKSLKNVVSPNEVVSYFGADILRLWSSSVNYCFDVSISNDLLVRLSGVYRKIRNTFRFCLSNLYDFKLVTCVNLDLFSFDLWILYKFFCLERSLFYLYNSYSFFLVYQRIYNFCLDDFGSKYFDLVKDRLYTVNYISSSRLSVQFVLYYILYTFLKFTCPILSFTSEEVWQHLSVKDCSSVFLSDFSIRPVVFEKFRFSVFDVIFWNKVFFLRSFVNKLFENYKNDFGNVSLDLELIIYCNFYWYEFLCCFKNELYSFFLVSSVSLVFDCNRSFDKFGFFIELKNADFEKCIRCWQRTVEKFYGVNGYFSICYRCFTNLYYF